MATALGYFVAIGVVIWILSLEISLDAQGLWLWSGLFLVLLSTAMTEPFFARPADAVVNGTAVALIAVAYPDPSQASWLAVLPEEAQSGRLVLLIYGVFVLAIAVTMLLNASRRPLTRSDDLFTFLGRLLRYVGSGRVAYSGVFLFSALATFGPSRDFTVLAASWLIIVVARPIEWVYREATRRADPTGTVLETHGPFQFEVAFESDTTVGIGSEVAVLTGTGVLVDRADRSEYVWALASVTAGRLPATGAEVRLTGTRLDDAVGSVALGTDLHTLRLVAASDQPALGLGSIVTADVRGRGVLYQIVGATVTSTPDEAKDFRPTVDAARLGTWDGEHQRFIPTEWIPVGGSLVRRYPVRAESPLDPKAIGHLPNTDLFITPDLPALITHGTAVLGVLGSGKSSFAKELVRRAVGAGVHVLVIDTSTEYESDLSDLINGTAEEVADTANAAIEGSATTVNEAVERGGNRLAFRDVIEEDIKKFLAATPSLRNYDVTRFKVTKQVSFKDRDGHAGFDVATMPELTAIIADAAFRNVRTERRDGPYLWIVLEEGHNLVPESTSISNRDDSRAVAQATKIFLQGRKYGLGALVVTQRTANVSKSLITQCNTIFCFRSHDDTTANFLRDRAGSSHVAALATLASRQALAFGRGIRTEDPIFISVNESKAIGDLLKKQRAPQPADGPERTSESVARDVRRAVQLEQTVDAESASTLVVDQGETSDASGGSGS